VVAESPFRPGPSTENKPVRQRRPQFDYDSVTTTQPTTALFSYYEKPKSSGNTAPLNSNSVTNERLQSEAQNNPTNEEPQFARRKPNMNLKPFEFSYNMPGRNTLMGAFNDMNARRVGSEMAMYTNSSLLHASLPETSSSPRPVYRVPIRVSGGNLVKVPAEAIAGNLNGRRPHSSRRLRVQGGFA